MLNPVRNAQDCADSSEQFLVGSFLQAFMGKGGGCFSSKEQTEQATAAVSPTVDAPRGLDSVPFLAESVLYLLLESAVSLFNLAMFV